MSTLAVFDFDGTLFRSPEPPPWSERGWFVDDLSLSPPCVPLRPGADWWIGKTLRAARKAIADQDTFAILCTGRVDRFFRWRIPEILKGAGLNFDEVHLNPGGGPDSTGNFKRKVIREALHKYPFINRVELWDDRQDLLQSYVQMLSRGDYEVVPHLVRSTAADVDCDPQDLGSLPSAKEALYVALVLDNPEELIAWWFTRFGEVLPTKYANHMTMHFKPTPEELEALPIGTRAQVRVTGVATSENIQVVAVDPGELPVKNDTPHITVATDGANPKGANRVIAEGARPVNGPTLGGTVGVSNGSRFYFSLGPSAAKVASRYVESKLHKRSVALMRFLSKVARDARIAEHVYVVGGAVRDFVLRKPIKDIDVVIDSVRAGMDSGDFAKLIARKVPAPTDLTTNQYGVAILSIKGDWELEGENLRGEVIEIANARTESYGKGESGKGYKPTEVSEATIEEDVRRREFTWNCMAGETLIPTEKGILRIDEIASRAEGDQQRIRLHVAGAEGPSRVVGWQYNGVAPTLQVKTSWGYEFTCTPNHPVLVLQGHEHQWVQTDQLEEGDLLCVSVRQLTRQDPLPLSLSDPLPPKHGLLKPIQKPHHMTPELAFVLGCIVAEGSNTHKRVSFSNSDEALLSRYAELFQAVFGFLPSRNKVREAGESRKIQGVEFTCNADGYDLYANSRTLVGWLDELGLYCGGWEGGKSPSHHKVVPWSILQADASSQFAFLAAYIEGDGSIRPDTGRITFCSSSPHVRHQLQVLLGAHGIPSKVKSRFVYLTALDSATLWKGVAPWMVSKGFGYKTREFKSRNRYGVPVDYLRGFLAGRKEGPGLYRSEDSSLISLPKVWEPVRNVRRLLYDAHARGDFAELLKGLQRISPEEHDKLQKLLDLRYHYVEVTSIKEAGVQEVYDLSMREGVEPAFVANGVLVHNTLMWRLLDLAKGPEKAEIIDLTGCGLRDLQERRMQCPADPNQTFSDDPSRILRAIKFIGRYGFKMTPETEKALRKHAPKMKQMPYEAIASILVNNILSQANAPKLIALMDDLGILDVLSEMISENQSFAAYLSRELSNPRYRSLLLDILDRGVPVRTSLSFLTPEQRGQVRDLIAPMTNEAADAYLAKLHKPPVDNVAIIEALSLTPKERGRIAPLARGLLLHDPYLTPRELTRAVINQW